MKFALETFSESLFMELSPFGILVCLINRGTSKTQRCFDIWGIVPRAQILSFPRRALWSSVKPGLRLRCVGGLEIFSNASTLKRWSRSDAGNRFDPVERCRLGTGRNNG